MADFGLLWDGRVIDLRPMDFGGWVAVWTGSSWDIFEGTLGAVADSKPLTAAEAASRVPAGILSQKEVQRFAERVRSLRKAGSNSGGKLSTPLNQ
jgi:hypothetical protein